MRSGRRASNDIIGHVASGAPGTDRSRRRFSPALIALALLVPAIAIAIGLALSSGGGGHGAPSAAAAAAKALAFPRQPATGGGRTIPPGSGTLVAEVVRPTTMRTSPHGRSLGGIGVRSDFGSPSVVLVMRHTRGWLGVISARSGNGRLGWIPQAATSLSRIAFEIKVSLSAHRLTVLDRGRVLQRYTVADGGPEAPTPTGRFEVTDRLATGDPAGPYGCCVIALSARAPHAIQGWGGGTRIAIHSTPETSTIGESVSHGCLRLTLAAGRWLMRHVPLGTPTVISG
jgi:lipoprotein-anchoring transpeptidase ErfK/SrfK